MTHDEEESLPILPTRSVCFELVDDADGRRLGVELQGAGDVCTVWDGGAAETFSTGRVDGVGQNDWDGQLEAPMKGIFIATCASVPFWAFFFGGIL